VSLRILSRLLSLLSGEGNQAPPGFEARDRISPTRGRSGLKNGL
jgi:hypothetical protein